MSILPTTLVAQTFKLSVAYNLTVTDQHGTGRTVSINSLGSDRYFRFCAAPNGDATASTATTEEAAVEFINHVQQRLNAGFSAVWSLSIIDQGLIKILYSGTGLGSITWDTNKIIRNLLGYTGNATSNLSNGAYVYGTYQPTHCLFCVGRETETPYAHERHAVAAARTRGGRVSAWFSGSRPVFSRFKSVLHPTTQSHQSSLAMYSTPIEPDRDPRTVSDAAGVAPPWSAMDFLGASWGHALGILPGTFQNEVAGTATVYDLAYLDPDSRESHKLTEASYIKQQLIDGLSFVVRAKGASL